MRPLALIRLPDNCTRTDSIRLASCARQVKIADQELDVDVVFSPFFNALPIRRCGLMERADSITVPTIYVRLPEMSVSSAMVSYSSSAPGAGEGIKVHSPVSDTTLTVDADGFIINYPDLAERI